MDFSFLIILGLLLLFGPYIVAIILGGRLGRLDDVLNAARQRLGDLEVRSVIQEREIAALRGEVLALRSGLPEDAAAARVKAEEAAAAPEMSEAAGAASPDAAFEGDEEAIAAEIQAVAAMSRPMPPRRFTRWCRRSSASSPWRA